MAKNWDFVKWDNQDTTNLGDNEEDGIQKSHFNTAVCISLGATKILRKHIFVPRIRILLAGLPPLRQVQTLQPFSLAEECSITSHLLWGEGFIKKVEQNVEILKVHAHSSCRKRCNCKIEKSRI